MSYATMFGVNAKGEFSELHEYKNAHRGAYLIWMELAKKYGIDPSQMLFNDKIAKQVWGLANQSDVAEYDRITMAITFDRVLIKNKDLQRVADALKESAKTMPDHCHVAAIAKDLEGLIGNSDVIAVGFNHTSVTNAWEDYHPNGDYELDKNLNAANEHFYLFTDENNVGVENT